MNENKENWIDKMIEREATPKQLREGTNEAFCAKYGISDALYYYHSSKPEIKAKVVEIALTNAKKYVPEVLENLGERAQSDNKAAELYMKFILQLTEKADITSGGSPIQVIIPQSVAKAFNIDGDNKRI